MTSGTLPAGSPPPAAPATSRAAFVFVIIVLAMAAAGLNASVGYLQLHFRKEPVPMRVERFENMPEIIGTWVQVARDKNLAEDMRQALATEEFHFCSYVDASKFAASPAELLARFKGKPLEDQRQELDKLVRVENQGRHPEAVLSVGLTYYTGKADTVAHIPERCYVGGGYDPVNPTSETWPLPALGRTLPVRFVPFEKVGVRGIHSNVAYLFNVNGRYESDSLAVRRVLQNLFAKYGYYAKVELMCSAPADEAWTARSKESMQSFLEQALPHIQEALPDWSQYESRK